MIYELLGDNTSAAEKSFYVSKENSLFSCMKRFVIVVVAEHFGLFILAYGLPPAFVDFAEE